MNYQLVYKNVLGIVLIREQYGNRDHSWFSDSLRLAAIWIPSVEN